MESYTDNSSEGRNTILVIVGMGWPLSVHEDTKTYNTTRAVLERNSIEKKMPLRRPRIYSEKNGIKNLVPTLGCESNRKMDKWKIGRRTEMVLEVW